MTLSLKVKNISGYVLPLFIIIIVAKLVYLYYEFNYNIGLLNIVTETNVSEDKLRDLEKKGHLLSSIGITFLILPLLYICVNKFKITFVKYFALFILFVTSIVGIYQGLDSLMNYLISQVQKERYSSYYMNIIRDGINSENIKYTKFLNKNFKNEQLSVSDKYIMANIYIALLQDSSIISKFIEKGTEAITQIQLAKKENKKKYKTSEKEFLHEINKIEVAWSNYNKARQQANKELELLGSNQNIIHQHNMLNDKIKKQYNQYKLSIANYDKSLNTELSKKGAYYSNLRRYFLYENFQNAKVEYANKMQRDFGRFIEPSTWCDDFCPSRTKIDIFIRNEANRKWERKTKVPRDIQSIQAYMKNDIIKSKIIKDLNKKGMIIDTSFDYSFESFKNYYIKSISNFEDKIYIATKQNIFKESGVKNIRLNLNWKSFVMQSHIQKKLKKKFGKKYLKAINKMILDKDVANFYKNIYRDNYKNEIKNKVIVSKESFKEQEKYQRIGDDAIKLLYIIPFSLFLSLIAGLLNVVSILTIFIMLLAIPFNAKYNLLAKLFIQVILIVSIIFYSQYQYFQDIQLKYNLQENESSKIFIDVANFIIPLQTLVYERYINITGDEK